ncbi:unnamed protein product [Chondrus crispus]|uniref:RNA-binding protein NOB1 n=1 Tax=Chondrus crispus TaxID=2769 RepID=R7QKI5_CHOCR|nr:unnamed protein product [Chondrus crispus]CDF38293.1 unnamed protein product [Chondrus crispus]|eukprot:XP_005718178.1 unnamed protein product [Chondrus crispus]
MPSELAPSRWVVLDTGALIAGTDTLYALASLTDPNTNDPLPLLPVDERVTFYITPDVASEVRDARARARLQALDRLGCVEQRVPSREAVAAVVQAAKNAGDYSVLSAADLRVLALTWMLDVERNGTKYLKQVAQAPVVGEIRTAPGVGFEEVDRWEADGRERREKEEAEKDGWTTVSTAKPEQPKKAKKRKSRNRKRAQVEKPQVDTVSAATELVFNVNDDSKEKVLGLATEAEGQALSVSKPENRRVDGQLAATEASEVSPPGVSSEFHVAEEAVQDAGLTHAEDDSRIGQVSSGLEEEISDDDGVGWINEENVEEHLARDGGEEEMTKEDRMRVACVTTDFAMQNTMLQMGLKLLSVDGRRTIRQIRRFALRCQSCSSVTRELHRKFCEKCGNATLHRVAFKVNKKGVARVFLNPKKKAILRGTKYPIPLPRGGRHNTDLILTEDQIDPVKQKRIEKQRERLNVDVLDPSNFYNAGARFNPHDRPVVVGYGKRNPNQVRRARKGKR